MATSVQYRHQVGALKITILLLTAVVWCFATRRWGVLLGLGGNLAEVQRLVWSQSHRRPISDATEDGKSDPPQGAAIHLAWT
jgi:hypothetical protein